MRTAVPALGSAWLIFFRVSFGALFLWVVAIGLKRRLHIAAYWRHYAILGFLNSALPFFLFAYAAQKIPAALLSVLNATAPIWGAILGAITTRSLPAAKQRLV